MALAPSENKFSTLPITLSAHIHKCAAIFKDKNAPNHLETEKGEAIKTIRILQIIEYKDEKYQLDQ